MNLEKMDPVSVGLTFIAALLAMVYLVMLWGFVRILITHTPTTECRYVTIGGCKYVACQVDGSEQVDATCIPLGSEP
jgi:hypothetical protein